MPVTRAERGTHGISGLVGRGLENAESQRPASRRRCSASEWGSWVGSLSDSSLSCWVLGGVGSSERLPGRAHENLVERHVPRPRDGEGDDLSDVFSGDSRGFGLAAPLDECAGNLESERNRPGDPNLWEKWDEHHQRVAGPPQTAADRRRPSHRARASLSSLPAASAYWPPTRGPGRERRTRARQSPTLPLRQRKAISPARLPHRFLPLPCPPFSGPVPFKPLERFLVATGYIAKSQPNPQNRRLIGATRRRKPFDITTSRRPV